MYDAFIEMLIALGILFVVAILVLIIYILIRELFFGGVDDPIYKIADGRAYLLHFRGDGDLEISDCTPQRDMMLRIVLKPRTEKLDEAVKDLENHIHEIACWGIDHEEVEDEQV